MTLTIGSLCSGYEGLGMSVQSVLGGDLVFVADPDPGATRILAHHHPDVPNLGDITTLAWSTAPRVDILTAGYPCQPFSQAGLRKGTDDERHIWPHICDAICVLRPRLVVLENVRGHLRRGFDTVLADLARVGFDASWVCVRASDVGAPHRRERLFVIAWPKGEIPYFPRTGVVGGAGGAVPGGVTLLPTPDASQGSRGGSQHPDKRRAGGHSVSLADVVEHLLPTPAARDWKSGQSNLLGVNSRPLNEVSESLRGWGEYAAAITRWEPVIGRGAPAPTEPSGKDGRMRHSPRLAEWMMGLPGGHVTAVPGLEREDQLRALGNGVVPQQGAYAFRLLLERVTAVAA